MNPEILERLLIDREAGELPADTLELLTAYLQTKPEAARETSQIEDILRLAKRALAPHRQPALPPRSFGPELRVLEREGESSRRLPRWAFAMAACFACGLFAGGYWLRSSRPVPVVVEKRTILAQVDTAPSAQSSGFWSADHLYRSELAPDRSPSSGLVWESPVKKPQIKSPL